MGPADGPAPGGERGTAALREFLATRDAACPCCGYNLRGLTGTRCPECNQELVLCVGLAEPRLDRIFLAGLIGASAESGLCAFMLGLGCYEGFRSGWQYGPRFTELLPIGVGALLGSVATSLWIRKRAILRRERTRVRIALALLLWAGPAACMIWFFRVVR